MTSMYNMLRHLHRTTRHAGGAAAFLLPMLCAAMPANAGAYQEAAVANCQGAICEASFPAVPKGKTLHARSTSCIFAILAGIGQPHATKSSHVIVAGKDDSLIVAESLPLVAMGSDVNGVTLTSNTRFEANEAILLTAAAGQHMKIRVEVGAGIGGSLICHLSGTLTP